MYDTNIKFWKKKSSNQYVLESDGSLTLQALVALGIIAALAHQYFRLGINMPGHHGLEWMTLLLFGRMQSRYRWAGLMIATGAATTYVLYASVMPLTLSVKPVFAYLLNGLCVDLLFRYTPGKLPGFIKGIILGGISFVAKPVFLLGTVMLFEFHFGSFTKHGYYYPVLTHFAFGAIGGICGMTLASATRKRYLQ